MTELPHNENVEAAIVARLLVDPEQIPVIGGALAPEDFYVSSWRKAYAAMQGLVKDGKTVDLMTLQDALGEHDRDLSDRITDVGLSYRAPVEEYAAIVRRDSFRRRVIGSLETVVRRAYLEEDRERLLAEVHDAVVLVSKGIEDGHLISPSRATDDYLGLLEERAAGLSRGLHYGIPDLDDILNPARGGDMIILAARPSVGKTALAETIADHWAQIAPWPVLFVSLEMSVSMLFDRAVARNGNLNATEVVRGHLTSENLSRARETAQERRSTRLWYLDNPYATTASVRAAAAKLRILAGGLSAIVVDYLQILGDAGDQEVTRVTRISRHIKAIAREFNVPVLALSQLNRSVTSREDGRPRLHDLRESGAIEQDADTVIALSRDLGTPLANFEVLKQRQGRLGLAQLFFDHEHVRYLPATEGALREMKAIKDATPGGFVRPRS